MKNKPSTWESGCDYSWHDGPNVIGLGVPICGDQRIGFICLECAADAFERGQSREEIIQQIEDMVVGSEEEKTDGQNNIAEKT